MQVAQFHSLESAVKTALKFEFSVTMSGTDDLKGLQHLYRCALARLLPVVTDLDAVKRSGWREQHILVISDQDKRLDFLEREFISRIGERLYGSGGRNG
jgi:hypothetical protein